MTSNDPPSRTREARQNVILFHGLRRTGTMETRHRGGNEYSSMPIAAFVQQPLQPATVTPKSVVVEGSGNRCSGLMATYVQRPPLQSRATNCFGRSTHSNEPRSAIPKKKRTRFGNNLRTPTTTATLESELRIDGGDKVDAIFNEMQSNLHGSMGHNCTSIYLKNIQEFPRSRSNDAPGDNGRCEDSPSQLFAAFKDVVEGQGPSWKKIRICNCSPSVLEVLLASLNFANIEELDFVDIHDNEAPNRQEDNRSISLPTSTQARPESQPRATPSTATIPSSIASLIVSVIRNTNRLKRLVVRGCNLKNSELLRIMNVLCSHPNHADSLGYLDLRFNRLTPRAIGSILSVHLRSSLHSLKTIKLRQGIRCVVHRSIRDAILRGLQTNRVVLECIDVFNWDKSVQLFLDVNRAKRRAIFCNNDLFPRSLWPLLLEQALAIGDGDDHTESDMIGGERKRSLLRSSVLLENGQRDARPTHDCRHRQASVVYHMFRNGGPMLLQQQSQAVAQEAQ